MRKLAVIFTSLLSLLLLSLLPIQVFVFAAGGAPDPPDTISASATTASVGQSVTLTVYGYFDDAKNGAPLNGGPQLPLFILITDGSGTVSPSRVTPPLTGIATFGLSATQAGSVTVEGCTDFSTTPGYSGSEPACPDASTPVSITFTTPASTSNPSHTTTTTPAKTTPTSPSTPTPTGNTITVPSTLSVTLWNGTNFGQSGQTLSPTTSATTVVGLADKNNTPLATATVNLSSAQDWSKATITYATDTTAHKAFVHGLTSAPGVVGGSFTLYVPYASGDTYVGICPGATSLNIISTTCPNLYYLKSGQSLTHSDTTTIPTGDTVTASIVTVNGAKYWQVSGLTGTGGFSSATNTMPATSPTTVTTPTKVKNSNTRLYVSGVIVMVVLLTLGSTYKWWLPNIKHSKPKDMLPTTTSPTSEPDDHKPSDTTGSTSGPPEAH